MSQESGNPNDPLRLSIIDYITSNPNSTIREIFEGIPASHTKVRHWLAQLTLSGTITPSSPIRSVPLAQITWSVPGGSPDAWILQDGTSNWILQDGTSKWILN